jgi:hypothetical protein
MMMLPRTIAILAVCLLTGTLGGTAARAQGCGGGGVTSCWSTGAGASIGRTGLPNIQPLVPKRLRLLPLVLQGYAAYIDCK